MFCLWIDAVVGLVGLEPTTSRLSGVRSNHLSYRPFTPEIEQIEIISFFQQSQHFRKAGAFLILRFLALARCFVIV